MQVTSFKKIVIWGYPLYSHTHSFVHYGWFKAFKHLGYETYWFDDNNYPENFDFNNTVFITEGYADKKIPILKNSIYFVHICVNPSKYLTAGCRLIDIRFNVKKTKDFSYEYTRPDDELVKLDAFTFYEKNANDSALVAKYKKGISGYEAVYMYWATDFLPKEINFSDAFIERTNTVYHVGSLWSANRQEFQIFEKSLKARGLSLEIRDPWRIKTTNEEAVRLVQQSYIAPDIRGTGATCDGSSAEECNHLSIGYIPCRIFKNISYGQLGITNSYAVKELMNDFVVYASKPENILDYAEPYRKNYEKILEAMAYVRDNHTFVRRIETLMELLA
jgi:hypothetical protein